MFYTLNDFPEFKTVATMYPALKAELDKANIWVPWMADAANRESGTAMFAEAVTWTVSPLYIKDASPEFLKERGLDPQFANLAPILPKRYPQVTTLLSRFPSVYGAALSRMGPKTRLGWHTHLNDGYLRFHMGYVLPPDGLAGIQVNDDVHKWTKEGEVIIFDGAEKHRAWNDSDQDRILFYFEFYDERFDTRGEGVRGPTHG
jgi:hypothetical protein